MKTEENIKSALIATYRKLREEKHTHPLDIIGLFINYYYRISKEGDNNKIPHHKCLSTSSFSCKFEKGIWVISARGDILKFIVGEKFFLFFKNLNYSDAYSLYLQSSFVDPINDEYYAIPIIKESFQNPIFINKS